MFKAFDDRALGNSRCDVVLVEYSLQQYCLHYIFTAIFHVIQLFTAPLTTMVAVRELLMWVAQAGEILRKMEHTGHVTKRRVPM